MVYKSKKTNKKAIVLSIVFVSALVAVYVVMDFYKNRDGFVSKEDEAFFEEFNRFKIIQGEVTKIEDDQIYLKIKALRSAPAESAELDKVVEEQKIATLSQGTLFFKIVPGIKEFKLVSRDEIKIGSKINVHFEKETGFEIFDAKRIQLLENE